MKVALNTLNTRADWYDLNENEARRFKKPTVRADG